MPLVLGVALAIVLLHVVRALPIGLSYWDVFMYLDASHRLAHGQVPHVDFMLPANSLPFRAYAIGASLIPTPQPVLLAQYAYLLLLAPPLALIVATSAFPRRAASVATLFVAVALVPYNWGAYTFTHGGGVDGYGVYNRSAGLALFVLVAAWQLRPHALWGAVASAYTLVILWFTKLPPWALGVAIASASLLSHARPDRRVLYWSLAGVVVGPALQGVGETLLPYLDGLTAFVRREGVNAPERRLARELSREWPVLLCFLLASALAVGSVRRQRREAPGGGQDTPTLPPWRHPALLLLALLPLAAVTESQNTGSHAYAFLLPAAVALWPTAAAGRWAVRLRQALVVVIVSLTIGRALPRLWHLAVLSTEDFRGLASPHVGAVFERDDARLARVLYAPPHASRDDATALVDSLLAYTTAGQVLHLHALSDLARAFPHWRARVRFPVRTVASLDFVDLAPAVLGLAPVRGVPVVLDTDRNLPGRMHPRIRARWATADVLLLRRCGRHEKVLRAARPLLASRAVVPVTPCWDAYLDPARVVGGSQGAAGVVPGASRTPRHAVTGR